MIIDKSSRNYPHPKEPRYAKPDKHAGSHPKKVIRVVTYNIYYAKRVKQAVKLLEENKNLNHADILCLQEMDEHSVEHIANHLHYNYVYYPAVRHPMHNRNFGNAILSKYPIISDEKLILPYFDKRKLQRIAVSAIIKIGEHKVHVICLHMKVFLKSAYRTMQVRKILELVKAHHTYCIIAGDFNTHSKSSYHASIDPLMEAGFELATHNLGWNYKCWYLLNRKSTLDHMFTLGFDVKRNGKVMCKKASDHIPLWVELAL